MKTIIIDGIEYNLTPKARFKKGDKIQYNKYTYTIKEVQEDCYVLDDDKVLTFNAQDVWELIEQRPTNLAKGEDYGIDGLYNAIRILEKTLGKVDGYQTDDGILEHECAISAVKKLYEQKPAWSEEDETTMNNISHIIRQYDKISKRENQPCYYVGDCLLWMQNIKDRVQPQSTWKPSEEQIIALRWVLNNVPYNKHKEEISGLIEQIKDFV